MSRRVCTLIVLLLVISAVAAGPAWSASWSASTSISDKNLVSVSCASTSFCMADDYVAGDVYMFNGSTWTGQNIGEYPTVLSCVSSSYCIGGSNSGQVWTFDGSEWFSTYVDTYGPYDGATACVSTSFCVVTDAWGNVMTWNGLSWGAPQKVDSGPAVPGGDPTFPDSIQRVSCASESFCVAVDASGRAITWNGLGWQEPVTISPYLTGGVSCPTASFCVASDRNGGLITYDGAGWSRAEVDPGVKIGGGVSCPTSSFCVAGDEDGNALIYNGSSWKTESVDPGHTLDDVSCASASFCVAIDNAGSVLYYTAAPRDEVPPSLHGKALVGQTLWASEGTWAGEPSNYTYEWLRCDAGGDDCRPIEGASGPTYLVGAEDLGHTIEVSVTATSAEGSSAPAASGPTATVEGVPLQADAGEQITATEGVPVTLDGSASTPAAEIADYRWEFGDGEDAEGADDAVLQHTYRKAGSYDATLTVSDGEQRSSSTVTVVVKAAAPPSEAVSVHVESEARHPVAGAVLLYISSAGMRTEATTGAGGEAVLEGLPEGDDTIYADAAGYRPGQAQVAVEHGAGHTTVTLTSGEVAASVLGDRELTLEEIEQDGINPKDPENQSVYEWVLNLAFSETTPGFSSSTPGSEHVVLQVHCVVNSAGRVFPGHCKPTPTGAECEHCIGGGSGRGGGGGGGGGMGESHWGCTSTECTLTPPSTSSGSCGESSLCTVEESCQVVMTTKTIREEGANHSVSEHKVVQWLILHGRATVLKQFFEVTMVVQNLSSEPFDLTSGSAALELPKGLSLAPTSSPQTLQQALPTIPGLGSASAAWVIRGDEPGYYALSASYQGKLTPFEAPVELHAALQQPLRVWGAEALSLKVQADSGQRSEGVPYHVRLGVTDVADVPLYNVELDTDENPHEHFIFQPRQPFSQLLGELRPGQTAYVRWPYILVPDATSQLVFDPALSSATLVGESVHPGAGIEAVQPPPLYSLTAPRDTRGYVHLHWEKLPEQQGYGDAEGYEIYSTPTLDTPFESAPRKVRATPSAPEATMLPANDTEAYVPVAAGERLFYAVSTVIEGHLQLEAPVIAAQAPEGPEAPEFGRCTKVAPRKGRYANSSCTRTGAGGSYEWLPVQSTPAEHERDGFQTETRSRAGLKLETTGKQTISCASEHSAGEYSGPKTVAGVSLQLSGCHRSYGEACQSQGAAPGAVLSAPLGGHLGVITRASEASKDKIGLVLSAPGEGTAAEFACGDAHFSLRGSVIVEVKTNKMLSTAKLKYSQKKGVQRIASLAGSGTQVLTMTIGDGASEQTGLSLSAVQSNEQPVEINSVY